uniref:Uncharacterized protein n=1 Tax=Anopheles merus TaxID=30066 RepID=A0A182V3T0_ANOME
MEEVLIARHRHLALGDGILDRDLLRSDGDEVLILQVDHHIGRSSLTVRHLQSLQINDCLREAKRNYRAPVFSVRSSGRVYLLISCTPSAASMFSWNTPSTLRGPFGSMAATRALIFSITASHFMMMIICCGRLDGYTTNADPKVMTRCQQPLI